MASAATVAARRRKISAGGVFYRVSCWIGAGAWTTWALSTSPWSDALLWLAAGTAAAGLASPRVLEHEQDVAVERAEQAAARARVDVAVEWEERIARICRVTWPEPMPPGMGVVGIETWPGECGMTLQVQMPAGTPWSHLRQFTGQLAADARIPIACEIEVSPGADRSVALVRVETVDVSTADVPWPEGAEGTAPLSINAPLRPARRRGGEEWEVSLLDDPMMIVGQRGSGKSNTIQVMNGMLLRCTDVLVWHIDLNGGKMSRPWMTPWLRGQHREPVIDWVATTVPEAIVMVQAAIDIAKIRGTVYADLMDSVDDDKIPVSLDVPAIVIVLDEGAEATGMTRGNTTLSAKLAELISIARSARVNLLLSTLRATSDVVPSEVKAQVGSKVFMRPGPDSEHEMAQLFGWNGISVSESAEPGSAVARTNEAPRHVGVRFMRMRPASDIPAVVAGVQGLRPGLDAPSVRAIVEGQPHSPRAYTDRHARYRAWYDQQRGPERPAADQERQEQEGPDMTEQPKRPAGDAMDDMMSSHAQLMEQMERLRRLREQAEASGRDVSDDIPGIDDREMEETLRSMAEDARRPDTWQDWAVTILRGTPGGMRVEDLHAALAERGVKVHISTLFRGLEKAGGRQVLDAAGKPTGRWTASG